VANLQGLFAHVHHSGGHAIAACHSAMLFEACMTRKSHRSLYSAIHQFTCRIMAGFITNSLTLVADSLHMLSRSISTALRLAAVGISERKVYKSIKPWPAKQSYYNTFGWVRIEVSEPQTFLLS